MHTPQMANHVPTSRNFYILCLVITCVASGAASLFGLFFLAITPLCYTHGPSLAADACASGPTMISRTSLATLAIPLVFGIWGHLTKTRRGTVVALLVCSLGYIPVPIAWAVLIAELRGQV
jgi:hypothetical protein